MNKSSYLPLEGTFRAEHLFRRGALIPEELEWGRFPMARAEAVSPWGRHGDAAPGGGEEPWDPCSS